MKLGPLTAARLTWLTARSGPRGTLVLPIVAFTLTTTLLLIVVAGALSFFRWQDNLGVMYQVLAAIALTLLVVPLLSLGGAAARLSARRHDEQLSTLRLLGATPALVGTIAVLEAGIMALAGTLLGAFGYFVSLPLVGLLSFRGEQIGAGNLLLPPLVILAVVFGVVLLAVISAVLGLHKIVISPLGVRTKQRPGQVSWLRFLFGAIGIGAAYIAISQVSGASGGMEIAAIVLVMVVAFGLTLGVLNLIGPALLGWLARRKVRKAQDPVGLLSARQILDSPKAAWRQVAGVAMTSFVAVFVGVALALIDSAPAENTTADDLNLITDVRTGVLITVVVSFLMVACSVGVNQAAQILDRAQLLISLDRLGMPHRTMEAARRRAVMMPLLFVSLGSAFTAAIVLFPLTTMSLLMKPMTLITLAAFLVSGIGLVWLSLRATGAVSKAVLRVSNRS
ncbi:permease [Acaricomes phytoseiuli]|uniref:FtsX-like permease family protein n=1 Tax=Acaricomes phytoseiuli TaxID=291968 RepID=UPI00036F2E66|nr:FtsX-like permease family protein [Acaricomes phytoseiuli]MCW1250666.1 permease [Acaricomes phytoseiuli]